MLLLRSRRLGKMLSRVNKTPAIVAVLMFFFFMTIGSCSSARKNSNVVNNTEKGDTISRQKPLHELFVRPYTWKESLEKNK